MQWNELSGYSTERARELLPFLNPSEQSELAAALDLRERDIALAHQLIAMLQPKQRTCWEVLEHSEFRHVGFGGSRGAAKSFLARVWLIVRRLLYPGTNGIILRRTSDKLYKNHIEPMQRELFKLFPVMEDWWREGKKELSFPNGSKLYFSYAEHEGDIEELFQGPEYGDICPEESGQFTEKELTMMRGANRWTGVPGFTPKMLYTFNPGGRSHFYLKRIFIDGARDKKIAAFKKNEKPEQYAFVQAYGWDNVQWALPELQARHVSADTYYNVWTDAERRAFFVDNSEFGQMLAGIADEGLRKAWLDGDWDRFEGLVFAALNEEIHDLDRYEFSFDPEFYRLIGAIDYGGSGITAAVECAFDMSENCFVIGEYYGKDNLISVHAKAIGQMFDTCAGTKSAKSSKHHGQEYILLDPNTAPDDEKIMKAGIYSVQEEYNLNGIITIVTHRGPISVGLNLLNEKLRMDKHHRNPLTRQMGSPKMFISKSRCPNLWNEMKEFQKELDEETGQVVYIGKKHATDCNRYIAMSRPTVHLLDEGQLCPEEQDAWRRIQHDQENQVIQ